MTIFNGKIHYKWAIFNSYVKLPEGKSNQNYQYIPSICRWSQAYDHLPTVGFFEKT